MDEKQIEIQMLEQLGSGDITVPSLPSVAQRIQKACEDHLVIPQTISIIIQSDPVISAKMIRVANSPLYAGRVPIEDINQAVTRLGINLARKLVLGFAVKDLFQSSSRKINDRMQSTWKESIHVASLSRLLSERLQDFDKERAQLAGLIHNIGDVVVLNYVKDMPSVLNDDVMLDNLLMSLRPKLGGMILSDWNFAQDYVLVGKEHGNWLRDTGKVADLCDLVILAKYHSLIGTRQQHNLPPVSSLPAFSKVKMDQLSMEEIFQFLETSQDKIRSISASLGFF